MEGLTEGRIVHFVMPNGDHRPAVVVNVWHVSGQCEGYVNLQVFTDGSNDLHGLPDDFNDDAREGIKRGLYWATSKCYSETKEPNTWHWIEKA